MPSRFAFLGAIISFIPLVKGDTCSELRANTNIEVSAPISPSYIAEQTEYWSASCSALKPSCIIFPKSAAEVSTIISVLNTNDEHFAVKSGGHSPNNYYASVDGGPLISTQNLDHANLDPATGILDFGPGNRLDGLAQKLQGTGWTFVGGRIGNTGTGGLMLGGGLSYMSAQHGWSASSVLEYELVLPNGTIAYPSATNHPSLFKALKGGGNNFGIVTNYKTQAYPQGDVYGGNLLFLRTPSTDKKILQAVRDFTEYNTDDPNTARTRTYADLMTFSNWVVLKGFQVQIGTETIPLPSTAHSAEVLEGIHAHWRNISLTTLAVPGIVASIAYQPFPKRIAAAARAKSPDLIDADPDADKLIIEMNYAFLNPLDYPLMDNKMQQTQDYFGRLKPENRALAREVAEEVDPGGCLGIGRG
ncbi:hypothetical protein B0T21DRAFT_378945, partial [Apiosordaria backusii]